MPVTMTGSPSPVKAEEPAVRVAPGDGRAILFQGRTGGLVKDTNDYQTSLQGFLYEQGQKAGYVDKKQEMRGGMQTQVRQSEAQAAGLYDDNAQITNFDSFEVAGEVASIGGDKMKGSGGSGLEGYHGIYTDVIREQANELTEQEEMMQILQVDMDEHEQDLIKAKKAVATMLDTDGDGEVEEDEKLSPQLLALFKQMNAYASRNNVDLFRALRDGGGKRTSDGNGAMPKTLFTSALLSCFKGMSRSFKEELLREMCYKFGTGPVDSMTGGFMDIKWRLVCNYVGERYMTFPPIQ